MRLVEIVKVQTKRQLNQFIKFPFTLYKDNPYWVPSLILDEKFTLDKNKNPAFEFSEAEYWLAYKDGKIAGRIAGIISHSFIEKWGQPYARFGWVDFIDDLEVSKALFDTVEDWAREKGLKAVHGPLGFCDLDKQGMLIEGFDEIGTFVTIYNYPYYMKHIEAHGYVKDAEWIELDIKMPGPDVVKKIESLAARAMEKYKLKVVPIKKSKDVLPYVKEVFDLINVGYEHLYGTIPLTDKQVECYVKQYFTFMNPDYVCFIQDESNRLAGFGIIFPSLTNAARKSKGRLFPFGFIHFLKAIKKNDTLDLYLIAIRPELRSKGVPYLLLSELTKTAIRNGVVHAIASPELETNHAVHSMWRNFDRRINRRRRCYIKRFEADTEKNNEGDVADNK